MESKPTIRKALSGLAIILISLNSISQNIAVNSTGNNPDGSAMLDVSSTNKGLLIPRISLSSLTDAVTIATPAHSLLVYNTNAALSGGVGFYYNSGTTGSPTWSKLLVTGTEWKVAGNAGTTPGTDFIGTTDAKALVFKTNNVSRMNISDAGVTKIGDGTNQLVVEADGHIAFEGTAGVWDDLRVVLDNGSNAAQLDYLSGSAGPQIWYFRDNSGVESMSFTVQLPHGYKEGTTIYPHLHWTPKSTAASGNVQWNFEYSWVNYNSSTPEAFPAITTNTVVSSAPFTANTHLIQSLTTGNAGISGTGKTISSVLICRIWRNGDASNASDTYVGNAGVMFLDFHYQIDGIGSHGVFTK